MKRKKAMAALVDNVSNAPSSDQLSHNYLQIAVYKNFLPLGVLGFWVFGVLGFWGREREEGDHSAKKSYLI